MTDTAKLAADYYLLRWAILRDEAMAISAEAKLAPGPLSQKRLRNQAALVDQYAVIAHHAAWREMNPEPEQGIRYYSGDRGQ